MTGVGSTVMQAGLPQSAQQAAAEQYAFLHLLLEIIIKFVCSKHTRHIHSLDIVDLSPAQGQWWKDRRNCHILGVAGGPGCSRLQINVAVTTCCHCQSSPQQTSSLGFRHCCIQVLDKVVIHTDVFQPKSCSSSALQLSFQVRLPREGTSLAKMISDECSQLLQPANSFVPICPHKDIAFPRVEKPILGRNPPTEIMQIWKNTTHKKNNQLPQLMWMFLFTLLHSWSWNCAPSWHLPRAAHNGQGTLGTQIFCV